MPRTLTQTFDRISKDNPERSAKLQRFYSDLRNTATLELLGTGSWRNAIEVIDQYIRTGQYLSRYEQVISLYDAWKEEFERDNG